MDRISDVITGLKQQQQSTTIMTASAWAVLACQNSGTVEKTIEHWWNNSAPKPELPFTSVCLRRVHPDERWRDVPQMQWVSFFRMYAAVLVYETINSVETKTVEASYTASIVKLPNKTLVANNVDPSKMTCIEEHTSIVIHGLVDLAISSACHEPVGEQQHLTREKRVRQRASDERFCVDGWFYFSVETMLRCQPEKAKTWNMFAVENDLSTIYPEDLVWIERTAEMVGELSRIVDCPNSGALAANIVHDRYCRLLNFTMESDRVRDLRNRDLFTKWSHSLRKGNLQRRSMRQVYGLWLDGLFSLFGAREEQVVQLFRQNHVTVFYQDSSALDRFSVYANRWALDRVEWMPCPVIAEKTTQITRIYANSKARKPTSISNSVPVVDERSVSLSSSTSSFQGSPVHSFTSLPDNGGGGSFENQEEEEIPLRLERVTQKLHSGRRFKQVFDPNAPIVLFDILVTDDLLDVQVVFEDLLRFLGSQGFDLDVLRGEQPHYELVNATTAFFVVETLLFADAKHLRTFLAHWHKGSSCRRLFVGDDWMPEKGQYYELSGGPRQASNGQGGIVIHPSLSFLLVQAQKKTKPDEDDSLFDRVCKAAQMKAHQAPARRLFLVPRNNEHSSLTGQTVYTDHATGCVYDAMSYAGVSFWLRAQVDDFYERLQAQCPEKLLSYAWRLIGLDEFYMLTVARFRPLMHAVFQSERQSRIASGSSTDSKYKDDAFGTRCLNLERAILADTDTLEKFVNDVAGVDQDGGTMTLSSDEEARFRKNFSMRVFYTGYRAGSWNDFAPSGSSGRRLVNMVNSYQYHSTLAESIEWMDRWIKENEISCSNGDDAADDMRGPVTREKAQEGYQTRQQRLRQFLSHCQPIVQRSNPVAIYLLVHRGLTNCEHLVLNNDEFLFHPNAYYKDKERTDNFPCFVVKARNPSGELVSAQRIYLDGARNYAKVDVTHNGISDPKKTYTSLRDAVGGHAFGRLQSGALLADSFQWPLVVCLAEGPETGLSMADASSALWVYAAFGMNNVHNFHFHLQSSSLTKRAINGKKKTRPLLIVCGDNDMIEDTHDSGQMVRSKNSVSEIKNIRAALSHDYELVVVYPPLEFKDFNDMHQYYRNHAGAARREIRKTVNQALVSLFGGAPNALELVESAAAARAVVVPAEEDIRSVVKSMDTD